MDKILTISVAAYNVEAFLDHTLSTLADPRYVDRLEVFVVDDGGQDRSLEIAKEYAEKYPETFFPIHKENGGDGTTIMTSPARATGKYFKLLDGDDWMDCDGLFEILPKLESCKEKIVITDYYSGPSETELQLTDMRHADGETVLIKDYKTAHPHGMWSIFYDTELLRSCHIVFPEHTLYTDQIYSTIPFSKTDRIRFFKTPVYCYRYGRAEQSTSKPSRIRHAEEMFRVCESLYGFYEENGKGNAYLCSRVARYYLVALKTFFLFPKTAENRDKVRQYEKLAQKEHPDLYTCAVEGLRIGTVIRFMRATGYRFYGLLDLIPERHFL